MPGERIYFQLRFFLFPVVRTAAATIATKAGEATLLRSAVTNERLATVFSLDGYRLNDQVARPAASVHRRLVEYLSAREVDVELWSADSEMQLGVCSVKLETLVRQGHQVAKLEAEHAVLEPLSGEPKGTLRMLLVNRGQPPTAYKDLTLPLPPPAPPPPDGGNPQSPPAAPSPTRARARHKVSALESGLIGGGGHMTEELQHQKHERLRQLRLLRSDPGPDAAHVGDDVSQHRARMAQAEAVRQDRKRQEVARRMDRFNTTRQSLSVSFACPSYFTVDFTNPYGQQATFTVHVLPKGHPPPPPELLASLPAVAPLQGVLVAPPEQSLMLVKDPEEWRRLATLGSVAPAPSGDFARLATGSFTLNPREQISLPFRYLDFDFPNLDATPQQAVLLRLPELAQQVAPNAKDFLVEVVLHQGPVLRRVEVTAVPQPSVVDRKIRYFEAEGAAVEKACLLPAGGEDEGTEAMSHERSTRTSV
ncbi:unnamed protein product [Durusdinium trenchii]|uniref:NPHP4 C2-like domain-containing protein n=1 Tax=Durusdinium trenchii TaxID=1381693 RepID=A0ABP0P3E5_9DINO